MDIIRRFFHTADESIFLFGPRGTGKSTWVNQTYPDALLIDLLSPDVFRRLSGKPEILKEIIAGNPASRIIVIDEVQKVPQLLDVVHQMIEKDRSSRFILTGSSARKLRRAGVDLMAGRAIVSNMHPFMAAELGRQFDINKALETGMIPLITASNSPGDTLKSYIALYMREEVQMESLVRSIGGFSRFLEAVSFSHSSVINMSNIARESEVGRKSVESYIQILEDLLLSFKLQVFSKRAKRQLVSHPKFYFVDPGIFRSLRPSGPFDRDRDIEGQALEGLVAQHIRAWIDYRNRANNMYYWRTKAGTEVDFVIYGEDGLWGLEVKNTDRIRNADFRGLKSFREEYPEANVLFLYRGNERLVRNDISCIPIEKFLLELTPSNNLQNLR
ncbi:MAG: ATP-binding protein [Elusimicrobia bacterium]|nr:ATP-binding protein [Elusimicrobiota bacterium]